MGLRITKRDIQLFDRLSHYGMLSSKQINKLLFKEIALTTVLRRLRLLERNGFIKRITGLPNMILWAMTSKALSFGGSEAFKRHWNKNQLDHDHKLNELRLFLEELGISKNWVTEHELRLLTFRKYKIEEAKSKLIPDGIMVVRSGIRNISVAIELELNLKSRSRIEDILERYLEKKELTSLWYICGSKSISRAIREVWKRVMKESSLELHLSLFEDVFVRPEEVIPAHFHAQGVSKWTKSSEVKVANLSIRNQRIFPLDPRPL